jgi:hypothetical protein
MYVMEIVKTEKEQSERMPRNVEWAINQINKAAEGLEGIGRALNALRLDDQYHKTGKSLAEDRLAGGLYTAIELLAWYISKEMVEIEAVWNPEA